MNKIKSKIINNLKFFPKQKVKSKDIFGNYKSPCVTCHNPFNCKNCDWYKKKIELLMEMDLM